MTVCAYLLISMLVATIAGILLRPRKPRLHVLSDSAGEAQFAEAAREEARRRA